MRTEKTVLRHIPYGNAKVYSTYDESGRIIKRILRSYETDVIILDYSYDNGIAKCTLEVTGLYSMTTRKHISAFMREFTPFYYDTAKLVYNKRIKLVWDI